MFKDTNNITLSENVDNLVYDGIGFNGIRYIQESGQKVQGKIYLDKTQPGLWYCLNTNTSINNTSDFTRADSTALLDKLQNLNNWTIIMTDEFIVPGPGAGTIKYPIKFKEVAAVIPLQLFDTAGNFSGNVPCVISFNLESCSVDYMDHKIASKCRCIVIGKI